MKVKTKSGYSCEIDESVLEEYTFLEAIAMASDTDNPTNAMIGTTKIVNLLLGKDKKGFMDAIAKKNDGKVPAVKVTEEVMSILAQLNDAKNSLSSEE